MSPRILRHAAVAAVCAATFSTTPLAHAAHRPVGAAPTLQTSSAAPSFQRQAARAARWQAGQLTDGRIYNSQFKFDDWGLTIDTGLMLAAAGTEPARMRQLQRAVSKHAYSDYALGGTAAGALAKTLLFASATRADVGNFGGHDVRAEVLKSVKGSDAGAERGRLSDAGKKDYSNVLTQSYGVLGLAPTGGVPQPVVDYLLRQRCPAGYFRLDEVVGETCEQSGSDADIDATALGMKALISAREHGASVPGGTISKTLRWLVSQQHKSGAFGSGKLGPNTNSTGLAANALASTPRTSARVRAANYVARMQITRAKAGSGPAKDEVGVIAYNRQALASALTKGIRSAERDQFRRATPQAYFALTPPPRAATNGYCTTDAGVTVAVDFRSLGGKLVVRCASAPVTTGLDALARAGFSYSLVTSGMGALVCRIQGEPSAADEDCQDTPPQAAYWSYWNAANGGKWEYSSSGAGNRYVTSGGFEGWSFSLNDKARAPGIEPTRPQQTATPTPTPASTSASPSAPASPTASSQTPSPAPGENSAAPDTGSAAPVAIGVGVIVLLAAGAGLAAWRRSRRA